MAKRERTPMVGSVRADRFGAAMVDLSSEMADLAERLGPAPGDEARLIQFVAPETGAGASTVAREFCRVVAPYARRGVWLIELDLLRGEQYETIRADEAEYGRLGEPTRASPDGSMFFRVNPPAVGQDGEPVPDARYLSAYAVGGARWWVTRFRTEQLRPGQSVQILNDGAYWEALRTRADYVVIDAPAADRSAAARAVAPFMDATIPVVAGDRRSTRAVVQLRDDLEAAGARCPGVVLNRAPPAAPRLLRPFFP